jgi:hypothetical protein
MTDLILLGVLGLGAGAAHSLMLRYLAYRWVPGSVALVPVFFITTFFRVLPVLAILGALMLWGVGPILSGFTGYWIGRTAVLVWSLGRRST